MKSPEQGLIPETEKKDSRSTLEKVYRILHTTDSAMICMRLGESISFYSLYISEQGAEIAEQKLKELGFSPKREGRKLFLDATFSKEEIEAAKSYTTEIK